MINLIKAYVTINTGSGEQLSLTKIIVEELSNLPGVVEVHPIIGRFDIIIKMEAKDLDELVNIIHDQIRAIPSVTRTETYIIQR